MNGIGLIYFLLGILLCYGARLYPRGVFNEESTSREQTKALTGIMTMGVMLHHLAQKTSAPWLPPSRIVPGLELFPSFGYPPVAVFLFCSGLGLYKSLRCKKDYLKHFVRRRIVPVVIAFYLSEFVYTGVRSDWMEQDGPAVPFFGVFDAFGRLFSMNYLYTDLMQTDSSFCFGK